MKRLACLLFIAASSFACAVEDTPETDRPACTGKCDDIHDVPTETLKAIEISSTSSTTCAITPDHNVRCWGSNGGGEAGNQDQPLSQGNFGPLWVAKLPGPTSHIVTAGSASCGYVTARTLDGSLGGEDDGVVPPAPAAGEAAMSGVYCWGNPRFPLASLDPSGGRGAPQLLALGGMHYGMGVRSPISGPALTAMSMTVGELCVANQAGVVCQRPEDSYTLAALSAQKDREVCGPTADGELCVSDRVPVIEIAQLSSSETHHCARSTDGRMWCWGDNSRGQLGNGTTTASPQDAVSVTLPGHGPITAMTAGGHFTCATNATGTYCVGSNALGMLGIGSDEFEVHEWSKVELPGAPDRLYANFQRACTLVARDVYCWGMMLSPRFIDTTPFKIEGFAGPVSALSMNWDATCAITDEGVQCFGENSNGELGHRTFESFVGPGPLVPSRAWLPRIDL